MALAVRMTALSAAKILCQNGRPLVFTPAKNIVSQTKIEDQIDSAEEHEHEKALETRSPETHLIYMHDFGEVLNVNLENIPKNLQREIIDKLGPFLTPETDGLERTHVRFNYLAEEIYIKNLFMSFRKMGYDCVFSRYNNDKGLASFTRSHVDSDSVKPTYSYYKSGLPNNC